MASVSSLVTVMTANVKMDTKVMVKNAKILTNARKNFMIAIVMRNVKIMMVVIPVLVPMDMKVMDSIVLKLQAMMWVHANPEIIIAMLTLYVPMMEALILHVHAKLVSKVMERSAVTMTNVEGQI